MDFHCQNTTSLKISYICTHQTKYLHLEEYILSTSNLNRIDHFKHKIAFRGGSRAAATSKMERFVIIVNDWKPLTIIINHSILHVAAALNPPVALKHNSQSNHFSQPNHDNEFTFYIIKVALLLVFGLKQFTKTRTKLFAFFLLRQLLISCFLFKTLHQTEIGKGLEKYMALLKFRKLGQFSKNRGFILFI